MEWRYGENRKYIELEKPPARKLRISGHRFPTVLGLNKYSTPFQAWCEIVGLVKKPFEENKYIIAGRTIEPKQIEYTKGKFPNVMSIEEYYGNAFDDYKYNNFKEETNIFGGVIDLVSTKIDMRTIQMIGECKTSSKPVDWENNNVPIDYLCQGMLYSYLKKIPDILFVVSFLNDMDYAHPENYTVTEENTKFVVKNLKDCWLPLGEEYVDIDGAIAYATDWWKTYVETGISPEFDEVKDKEYLDIIRQSKPCEDNVLIDVCSEAINLAKEIEEIKVSSGLKEKEALLKKLETNIKETMIKTEVENCGNYKLTSTHKQKFDEKAFAESDKQNYEQYVYDTIEYKLSKIKDKEKEND